MQNSDGTIKKLSPAAARELLDSKDFRGQIIVQPSRRTKGRQRNKGEGLAGMMARLGHGI